MPVVSVVLTAVANPGSWLSIVHVAACGDGHGGLQDHGASCLSVTGETATGAAGAAVGQQHYMLASYQTVFFDNKANHWPIDAGVLSVGGGRRWK